MTATIINIADRRRETVHASDCAVYNEPAYPAGPCDCEGEILYASPPLKDTAPAEYVAPEKDGA